MGQNIPDLVVALLWAMITAWSSSPPPMTWGGGASMGRVGSMMSVKAGSLGCPVPDSSSVVP